MKKLITLLVGIVASIASVNAQNIDVRGICTITFQGKNGEQLVDTILKGFASLYVNKSLAKSEFESLESERQAGHRHVTAKAQEHCTFNASGEWDFEGVEPGSIVIVVPYGNYMPKMFTIDSNKTFYPYEIIDNNPSAWILGVQVVRAKRNSKTKEFNSGNPNNIVEINTEGNLLNPQQSFTSLEIEHTDVMLGQEEVEEDIIFEVVEKMPHFPGDNGDGVKMTKFFKKNLKYPKFAKKNNIEGTVWVSFIVGKDGSIFNVFVAEGVHELLDKEAVRVVQKMPNWVPGSQQGKPVSVKFTIPIKFSLK